MAAERRSVLTKVTEYPPEIENHLLEILSDVLPHLVLDGTKFNGYLLMSTATEAFFKDQHFGGTLENIVVIHENNNSPFKLELPPLIYAAILGDFAKCNSILKNMQQRPMVKINIYDRAIKIEPAHILMKLATLSNPCNTGTCSIGLQLLKIKDIYTDKMLSSEDYELNGYCQISRAKLDSLFRSAIKSRDNKEAIKNIFHAAANHIGYNTKNKHYTHNKYILYIANHDIGQLIAKLDCADIFRLFYINKKHGSYLFQTYLGKAYMKGDHIKLSEWAAIITGSGGHKLPSFSLHKFQPNALTIDEILMLNLMLDLNMRSSELLKKASDTGASLNFWEQVWLYNYDEASHDNPALSSLLGKINEQKKHLNVNIDENTVSPAVWRMLTTQQLGDQISYTELVASENQSTPSAPPEFETCPFNNAHVSETTDGCHTPTEDRERYRDEVKTLSQHLPAALSNVAPQFIPKKHNTQENDQYSPTISFQGQDCLTFAQNNKKKLGVITVTLKCNNDAFDLTLSPIIFAALLGKKELFEQLIATQQVTKIKPKVTIRVANMQAEIEPALILMQMATIYGNNDEHDKYNTVLNALKNEYLYVKVTAGIFSDTNKSKNEMKCILEYAIKTRNPDVIACIASIFPVLNYPIPSDIANLVVEMGDSDIFGILLETGKFIYKKRDKPNPLETAYLLGHHDIVALIAEAHTGSMAKLKLDHFNPKALTANDIQMLLVILDDDRLNTQHHRARATITGLNIWEQILFYNLANPVDDSTLDELLRKIYKQRDCLEIDTKKFPTIKEAIQDLQSHRQQLQEMRKANEAATVAHAKAIEASAPPADEYTTTTTVAGVQPAAAPFVTVVGAAPPAYDLIDDQQNPNKTKEGESQEQNIGNAENVTAPSDDVPDGVPPEYEETTSGSDRSTPTELRNVPNQSQAQNEQLQATIAQLKAQNEQQQATIALLQAKLLESQRQVVELREENRNLSAQSNGSASPQRKEFLNTLMGMIQHELAQEQQGLAHLIKGPTQNHENEACASQGETAIIVVASSVTNPNLS